MRIYIIVMEHKKAPGYYEIIEIFGDKEKAETRLSYVNKDRPPYSKFLLKEYVIR